MRDVTENGTRDRSLECNIAIGRKDQHYLAVPRERHNALHSHSLLPLGSGESAPGHCIYCLIPNASFPRQAPEKQSNSKEFKVKAHPGRDWFVSNSFILIYVIGIFVNFRKSQSD